MAYFAVGLSLYLLVSSFSFAETVPSTEILPCSCKLADRAIPFGFRLRLPMARWPDGPASCTSVTRSAGSLVNNLGFTLPSFLTVQSL
jgi:hypothetical protein